MPHLFDDGATAITNIERWQERKRQVTSTANSVTDEQVRHISGLARMFPFASPGVVRALGQAGLGPDDPVTQFAILQEMLRNHSTNGEWSGQLGKQVREPRYPTKTNQRPVDSDEARAFNSPANPANKQAAIERAQGLLKEGETLGVFDPTTQVLHEPEFSEDENGTEESKAHRIFSQLQDTIFGISGSPVPYLARDGKIRGFTPSGGTTGDREIDLGTGKIPEFDSRPDPTVVGNYRNESGVGGSLGRIEDYGAQQQADLSSDIIRQIFAGAENNPQLLAQRDKALNVQTAGIASLPNGNLPSVTPAVRGVAMAFDAPIQEIAGQVRNVYGAMHGEDVDWLRSQSDLGLVLPKVIRGQDVDVGNGFFVDPESQVARERRQRESELGQIGGHNLTIGRILANGVGMEPDSKAFLIVSGLADGAAQLADPTAFALGSAGNISDARKLFSAADEEAGAFKGLRALVHGPTFETFANKNTDLFDKLAGMDSAYDIAKLTKFKLGPQIEGVVSRIKDPINVRAYLAGQIERGQIQRVDELVPNHKNWSRIFGTLEPVTSRRMFQMMPDQTFDLENPTQVATNIVRVMKNAHADESQIRTVYNMVASAKNKNGLRAAVMESQEMVGGILYNYGIKNPEFRSILTRTNTETYAEDLRGHIDEVGADVPAWDTIGVDGIPTVIPGPHLPLEHIGRYMNVADQRAVRRMTTRFNFLTAAQTDIPLLTSYRAKQLKVAGKTIKAGSEPTRNLQKFGAARLPIAAVDYIMGEVLKPLWLARLAWPIRVVGEEQLRMAGAGLDSMTKHPISYLATVIGGDQNKLQRIVDKMSPGLKGKLGISPSGEFFEMTEELAAVTYRSHGGWLDQPGTVRSRQPTVFNKNNIDELADWRSSWAHELALLHHDPVSNYIANHNFEDSVQWLTRGPGLKYRKELMAAHPGNLESPDQIQRYVQLITDDISRSTANHPDLIDVVKTGKFSTYKDGKETAAAIFHDKPAINPEFTKHLTGYQEVGPEKIKGRASLSFEEGKEFPARWSAGVDRIMSTLMGTPTSTLSRSPAFRQFVWRRAAELLPYADGPAREVILANARKAGLNARQLRTVEKAALRGKKAADGTFIGKLNADDVDLLAKGHAIDDTKELLYDLSERSQITDILRTIIPFGEAWKEVITRWAKLATISGPGGVPLPGKPVRRFQQVIQGARGESMGKLMGAGTYVNDDGEEKQRGFFYKNEFGEEVYAYPGSEWFTSAVTGVPVPLTGRVQGLNMFGTIIPGLGPVAQIPIAWFLQDKPQLDEWREQLLPFGAPGANEKAGIGDIRSYLPAWAKTAYDVVTEGGYDDRTWNSSVMYAATYLYSTGEYGDTTDEQSRLLEDAMDAVKGKHGFDGLYAIRSLGQFMLPSSPTFEWATLAEDGRLINTRILAEEYYESLATLNPDEATQQFLETYGPYAIGAIVPHTRATISAVPVSLEGAKWVADHPNIKKKFDLVYGFFAPEGEFHMPTYARNFVTGERENIEPEQWLNLRDTLIGNYHYQRVKDMLGPDRNSPNEEQAAWLRTERKRILESYPNWNNKIGLEGKASDDNDRQIAQLYKAANDPTIKRTDAGKGLAFYIKIRDMAIKQAEDAGFASFKTANDMAPTRQWLSDEAHKIMAIHPGFERLWDVVFSRELEDAPVEPRTAE